MSINNNVLGAEHFGDDTILEKVKERVCELVEIAGKLVTIGHLLQAIEKVGGLLEFLKPVSLITPLMLRTYECIRSIQAQAQSSAE